MHLCMYICIFGILLLLSFKHSEKADIYIYIYIHEHTLSKNKRVLIIVRRYTFDDEDGATTAAAAAAAVGVCVEMVFEKPNVDDNAIVVCSVDVEATFGGDETAGLSQLLSALGSLQNISEYGGNARVESMVFVVFTLEVEVAAITEVDALFAADVIRITSS